MRPRIVESSILRCDRRTVSPRSVFLAVTLAFAVLTPRDGLAQSWEKLRPTTAAAPAARYNATAIFDDYARNIVIFGGRNSDGNFNDVWCFNLDTLIWREITPADTIQPAKRFGHDAVYDPIGRNMLVWSGQGTAFFNDLWAFHLPSHEWTQLKPPGPLPSPRYGSASVYDPVSRQLVMFSGFTDVGRFDDTQAYDIATNTWIDVTPPGANPVARCLHTACFDSGRHRMIIYGGQRSGPLDDIWAFDLAARTWSDLTPAARPSGRIFPSSVCHNDQVFVFGGRTTEGNVDELLSFDLRQNEWNVLQPAGPHPESRSAHAAVSLGDGAMIIFGGLGDSALNDLWRSFDEHLDVSEPPSASLSFGLLQNYPNPFNSTTTITFRIAETARTRLQIFDLLGREISTILDEELAPGAYSRTFDARNTPSGVYAYRLQSGSTIQIRTFILIR